MHSVASSGEPPCSHQNSCCLPHTPRAPTLRFMGLELATGGSVGVDRPYSGANGCQGCTLRAMSREGTCVGKRGLRGTSLLQTGSCGRTMQTEEAWLGLFFQPAPPHKPPRKLLGQALADPGQAGYLVGPMCPI